MNLEKMRMLVRYELGLEDDKSYGLVNNEVINHFLNQAQLDVRIDLEDRIENYYNTFTASQRMYTLPEDYLKIREIWVSRDTSTGFEGYKLEPRGYSNLVDNNVSALNRTNPNTNVTTGRPERYYVSSDHVLYVDPLPSSASRFDLFYLPYPSDMTSDTSEPDFKDVFHQLIVARASYLVARSNKSLRDMVSDKLQLYAVELRRMKPFAMTRETQNIQVRYNSLFTRV